MKKSKFFKVTSALAMTFTLSANIASSASAYTDITKSFSQKLDNNALNIAYYAYEEKELGTYPASTGFYFASKVKTGGDWDYKRSYGYSSKKWVYRGNTLTGEDVGNMHYGYVGRAAGFGTTVLKTAAGAYQIYSGTSSAGWYKSYFDDPNDQKWIIYGIDMWNHGMLPDYRSMSLQASEPLPIEMYLNFDLLSNEEKEKIKAKVKDDVEKLKKEDKKYFKEAQEEKHKDQVLKDEQEQL
jgi:hypothetical protein